MLGIEVLLIVIAIMLGVTFVRMGTRGRPHGLTSRCLNCREIIPDSAKVCPCVVATPSGTQREWAFLMPHVRIVSTSLIGGPRSAQPADSPSTDVEHRVAQCSSVPAASLLWSGHASGCTDDEARDRLGSR